MVASLHIVVCLRFVRAFTNQIITQSDSKSPLQLQKILFRKSYTFVRNAILIIYDSIRGSIHHFISISSKMTQQFIWVKNLLIYAYVMRKAFSYFSQPKFHVCSTSGDLKDLQLQWNRVLHISLLCIVQSGKKAYKRGNLLQE